jgi:hypothetical protein
VTSSRLAIVTCAAFPELEDSERLVLPPLAARGVTPDLVGWDDPAVDWSAYDLAVVRSTWDYSERRDEFVAWAASVPRLANPAPVLRWNTDKRYLRSLAEMGVAVVPTSWLEPGEDVTLPSAGQFVVKPAVSAGGNDTGRYDAGDAAELTLAAELARRILDSGRTVMVQPYLAGIDTAGETALLFLGGEFSHAIRKGPILTGPFVDGTPVRPGDHIMTRTPSDLEHAVAAEVLAAARECVPEAADLLYARVDLVPGPDGAPVLLELELTEPSLFLADDAGAADRFADAIVRALARASATE